MFIHAFLHPRLFPNCTTFIYYTWHPSFPLWEFRKSDIPLPIKNLVKGKTNFRHFEQNLKPCHSTTSKTYPFRNAIPDGNTTLNRCRFDVDITSIPWKPNLDEFPRCVHVLFRRNFDGQNIHVVPTLLFFDVISLVEKSTSFPCTFLT